MKSLFFVMILIQTFSALAVEVKTDCPAMNESREKIVKQKVSPSTSRSKVSIQ